MTSPLVESNDRNRTHRKSEMYLLNEELARARSAELLAESEQRHRTLRLIAARRLSRRAEAAAAQARLRIARSLG